MSAGLHDLSFRTAETSACCSPATRAVAPPDAVDDRTTPLIDLVRTADLAFINLETTVRNRTKARRLDAGHADDDAAVLLDDLKWMGFGLLPMPTPCHRLRHRRLSATLEHLRKAACPARAPAPTWQARHGLCRHAGGRVGLVADVVLPAVDAPPTSGYFARRPASIRAASRHLTVDADTFAAWRAPAERLA